MIARALLRPFGWVAQRVGLRPMLSLVLLLVVLISVALGLANEVRGLQPWLALSVAGASLLTGWGLVRLSVRGWVAMLLAIALGFVFVFLRVAGLGEELLATLWSSAVLGWQVLRWLVSWVLVVGLPGGIFSPVGIPAPDWAPALATLVALGSAICILGFRVVAWVQALAGADPVFDPVAAALVWSLALWSVGAWAGWVIPRQKRPLMGVAPAGVLLVATLSYAGGATGMLLLLLTATLLLLALMAYDVVVRRWEMSGTDYPVLWAEVAVITTLLSLSLVGVAALAPSLSLDEVIEFFQELGQEQADDTRAFAGSLGVEQRPGRSEEGGKGVGLGIGQLRTGGLPRRHLIGSGPELSQQVVMIISTGDLSPGPPEMLEYEEVPRYYWRSITYDQYYHTGWRTGPTELTAYAADQPVFTPTLTTRRLVRQDVEFVTDMGGLLHVAGMLVVADHDYFVEWRSYGDPFGATTDADVYRAESVVPVVSEAQLRSTGSDYPGWLQARYLVLPADMPERVLALARDLTATELTPYDRAVAIETYLRAFPYTLDVPTPPQRQDVVDYFLFDLQEGYCDYYATSMVVLARAAGLPARLAIGYAGGGYDPFEAHYVVTEANAHAWAEVYFPGYGWVVFEPTGGLPAIERPAEMEGEGDWPGLEAGPLSGSPQGGGATWSRQFGVLVGVVLLVLAWAVWPVVEGWWLRRLDPAAVVRTLYGRLLRHGERLLIPVQAGDTPYEFAAVFADWVTGLARRKRWAETLLPTIQDVRRLADAYVQASYTSHLLTSMDQWRSIQAWKRVRWRLWLAWLGQGGLLSRPRTGKKDRFRVQSAPQR